MCVGMRGVAWIDAWVKVSLCVSLCEFVTACLGFSLPTFVCVDSGMCVRACVCMCVLQVLFWMLLLVLVWGDIGFDCVRTTLCLWLQMKVWLWLWLCRGSRLVCVSCYGRCGT